MEKTTNITPYWPDDLAWPAQITPEIPGELLVNQQGFLSFRFPSGPECEHPWSFDFVAHWEYFQRHAARSSPRQLVGHLASAVGRGKKLIWDGTCGTGSDALSMLFVGHQVISWERHPLIYLLLKDAWKRLQLQLPSVPWELKFGDVREHQEQRPPDVIYLDPMFSSRAIKHKSLPRKDLRMMRQLMNSPAATKASDSKANDDDEDVLALLTWSRSQGAKKVIWKKHPHAPPGPWPAHEIYRGKMINYEVFFHH